MKCVIHMQIFVTWSCIVTVLKGEDLSKTVNSLGKILLYTEKSTLDAIYAMNHMKYE